MILPHHRVLLRGASALALSFISVAVMANCSPEPTVSDQATQCIGADTDGLTVSTNSTDIIVDPSAQVFARPDHAGAIVLQASSGTVIANLDNSGLISSTSGPAISTVGNAGFQAYQSITNQAGAMISGSNGGINVVVDRLNNAGTIDGGGASAYSFPNFGGTVLAPSAIFNSGTIVSNSTVATIDFPFGSPQQFLNSGTIRNEGNGLAVDTGSQTLGMVNDSTGVISTNGPVALRSTFQVNLINSGTINGSVIGGSGFDDRIDTKDGTINGDVILNDGNDRLIATLGASRFIDNVSGVVDGGNGTDLLELVVRQDRTLTNAILPNAFELLQLDIQNGATLTLNGNTVPSGGYSVRGTGTVGTGSSIVTVGPVLVPQVAQQNLGFEALNFINENAILTDLNAVFQSAVSLENLDSAINGGTIRATGGNGAAFRLNSGGLAQNSGTIEATLTALTVSGRLNNDGVIRSTNGTALENGLGGGVIRSLTSTNQGLIEGETMGASISGLTFINNGMIKGDGGVGLSAGSSTIENRSGGTIYGTTTGIAGTGDLIVVNSGTVLGGVDFRPGFSSVDAFIDTGGSVVGDVHLGDGGDYYIADIARGLGGVTGVIDAGDGSDTLRFRVAVDAVATPTVPTSFEKIGYELENGAALTLSSPTLVTAPLEFSGSGRVDLFLDALSTSEPALDLGPITTGHLLDPTSDVHGDLRVVSHGTITVDGSVPSTFGAGVKAYTTDAFVFAVDDRSIAFENAGTIDVVGVAGSGIDLFAIRGGTEIVNSGTINLANAYGIYGANTFANTGSIRTAASTDAASIAVYGVKSVNNSGTIQVDGTAIWLDPGFDQHSPLKIENSGLIESRDGPAIRGSVYSVEGTIHNGAGGTIRGNGDALSINGSANVINEGSIAGNVVLSTQIGTGASSLSNSGAIAGGISFGGGSDHLTNRGTITGTIDLGDGADILTIGGSAAFDGIVSGGADDDVIQLVTDGTAAHPATVDLQHFSGFERLENTSGIVALTSSISMAQIDVTGGRLIGTIGTALTGNVAVYSGATFGSAGTVNGNVNVAGTLSPGASPGTMTVNGDVTLVSGSTTLFEMTPTVSDALVINGSLNIASDTTLAITGSRPLTPGITYNLITASNGISGRFTTINKPDTVVGFVRQSANALQLLGQFQLQGNANPQVSATVDYVNGLLIGGSASPGLLAAVPNLLDASGFANPAVFARLNAEPYASASQIGVESGMVVSNALRGTKLEGGKSTGLFGFGQAFGGWRRLPGTAAAGTSQANVRSSGVLGGLGFGSQSFSVGAFVGRIDASQHIPTLGASTNSQGTIAGVLGRAMLGNIQFAASASWDGSRAGTKRSIVGGASASSRYRLRGWTIDATAGYRFALGDMLSIQPEIGFTHIASRRARAVENGAEAFDLNVASRRTNADFLSGDVKLAVTESRQVRPSVSVGIRHQVGGRAGFASGAFVGSGSSALSILGAKRDATLAMVSGGLAVDVSRGLVFFANGHTEFGADSSGESANAGLRLSF